jgi:hypothetical protein
MNPFQEMEWNPGQSDLRRFSLRSCAGGLAAGLIVTLFEARHWIGAESWGHVRYGMFAIAGWALLGLILPAAARLLYRSVHGLSALVTFVSSAIILALFYFLILTPYALCLRLMGHDSLRLKPVGGKTMWQPHRPPENIRQYYRQY